MNTNTSIIGRWAMVNNQLVWTWTLQSSEEPIPLNVNGREQIPALAQKIAA